MRIACAWCQHEDRPAVMGQKDPADDTAETHGICDRHLSELRSQLRFADLEPR